MHWLDYLSEIEKWAAYGQWVDDKALSNEPIQSFQDWLIMERSISA